MKNTKKIFEDFQNAVIKHGAEHGVKIYGVGK